METQHAPAVYLCSCNVSFLLQSETQVKTQLRIRTGALCLWKWLPALSFLLNVDKNRGSTKSVQSAHIWDWTEYTASQTMEAALSFSCFFYLGTQEIWHLVWTMSAVSQINCVHLSFSKKKKGRSDFKKYNINLYHKM